MIHITKSKTGYLVISVGNNGEPLDSTEILSSKQKCWKNIQASTEDIIGNHNSIFGYRVQDDTTTPATGYYVYPHKKVRNTLKIKPNYIPGNNPKK